MPSDNIQSGYTFIDLFAGAGGLSEGFLQAGFLPIAHVEMNEFAALEWIFWRKSQIQ